ncbi:DUF2125 domain-containing protein [Shimia ponticola]|uniref:DUF2125 domain-containing protein n=1 Tax=Shimia ponticola TaxID=2582893 RepID=UPI0011BF1EFB|nr:DUF2125 domain-containing protein [Shimia ponticola]
MSKPLLSTTLLASTVLASPLWADLTAEDVWAQMQDTYVAYGGTVAAASETRSGNTLTAADVTMTIADEEVDIVFNLGDVAFVEQGSGSVEIVTEPEMNMVVSGDFEGTEGRVVMSITTDDLVAVASGTPEVMTTTYSASDVTMSIDELPDMPDDAEFVFTFAFAGMNGSSTADRGDMIRTQSTMTSASLAYDVVVTDPGNDGNFTLDFDGQGLAVSTSTATPADMDMADIGALYADPNVEQSFTASMAASAASFTFADPDGSGAGEFSAGGGRVQGGLTDGGFSYEGGANDIALSVEVPDLPVPLNFAMGGYNYALASPIIASDDAKPFRLGLGFQDVTLDPFLWNLFDPGEVLPRDPATISFDISGLGRLLVNLFDPEQMEEMMMDDVPGEVTEIALDDLDVRAAGAALSGSGSFVLDNSDTQTFDGLPRPEGKIDLQLLGANGLLDKLVQMGLVPEDQVMGARMMMGLFAVPGSGEDSLQSTIEVNADGHVLANGQRLR